MRPAKSFGTSSAATHESDGFGKRIPAGSPPLATIVPRLSPFLRHRSPPCGDHRYLQYALLLSCTIWRIAPSALKRRLRAREASNARIRATRCVSCVVAPLRLLLRSLRAIVTRAVFVGEQRTVRLPPRNQSARRRVGEETATTAPFRLHR